MVRTFIARTVHAKIGKRVIILKSTVFYRVTNDIEFVVLTPR